MENVVDLTMISERHATSMHIVLSVAVLLMLVMAKLEGLRRLMSPNNTNDPNDNPAQLPMVVFTRFGLLVFYQMFFYKLTQLFFLIENSVLSAEKWGTMLGIVNLYQQQGHRISWTVIPTLFAWLGAFSAIFISTLINHLQYAVLGTLYILGPLAIVFSVFSPAKYVLGTWLKSVVGVCLWTLFLKAAVSILSDMQLLTLPLNGNIVTNSAEVALVSGTLVALMVASPFIALHFINGHAVGASVMSATSLISNRVSLAASSAKPGAFKNAIQQAKGVKSFVVKTAGSLGRFGKPPLMPPGPGGPSKRK